MTDVRIDTRYPPPDFAIGSLQRMRVVIDDGRWTPWDFTEYVRALCAGERPSFLYKEFSPGPRDNELLIDQARGVMTMNSRTHREYMRAIKRRGLEMIACWDRDLAPRL